MTARASCASLDTSEAEADLRKTLAVVIKTVDFKDSDRMLTFLTKDFGIMGAKVKGAKKQTSKLFCASTLFCCGEYTFYEKNGFFGVKGCDIKHTFYNLQHDYDAFSAACFIADAAGKVMQEEYESPKLFALAVNTLYALDTASVSPGAAICYFIQRLLYIEGLYPNLDNCVFCDSDAHLSRLSTEHGGVVCERCADKYGGAVIDRAAIDALKGMERILPKDIAKVSLSALTEKKLLQVLIAYLEHTLQKPLKSSRFIDNAL